MNTATWLEHAFAEAEWELDGFVSRLTSWRDGPRLRVAFDHFATWTVRDIVHDGRLVGQFSSFAAAWSFAEGFVGRTPGASLEPWEPTL